MFIGVVCVMWTELNMQFLHGMMGWQCDASFKINNNQYSNSSSANINQRGNRSVYVFQAKIPVLFLMVTSFICGVN